MQQIEQSQKAWVFSTKSKTCSCLVLWLVENTHICTAFFCRLSWYKIYTHALSFKFATLFGWFLPVQKVWVFFTMANNKTCLGLVLWLVENTHACLPLISADNIVLVYVGNTHAFRIYTMFSIYNISLHKILTHFLRLFW